MLYRIFTVDETQPRGGKPRIYAEFWLRVFGELWSHRQNRPRAERP